jgi:hypothetical protein
MPSHTMTEVGTVRGNHDDEGDDILASAGPGNNATEIIELNPTRC